jgi:hypothetical protein
VEIHPVTPDRWRDMVELFERRGVRGGHQNAPAFGCWCMYWRNRPLAHGEPKKHAMARIVRAGREPGSDYMGHVELYRDAGFDHVRDANKRVIVRLERG